MDRYQSKPRHEALLRKEIPGMAEEELAARGPKACKRENPPHGDWDLKELLWRLDGDQQFLRELLEVFRHDSRANLEKARLLVALREYAALSRTAHTLKGMLKNLAMAAAAETAAALEKAAGAAQGEQAEELLGKLEQELAKVSPQVEAQLAGVTS